MTAEYDVYRRKTDPTERIATRPSAGLPSHVDPEEWELMRPGASPIIDDAEEDIEARGFSRFKLSDGIEGSGVVIEIEGEPSPAFHVFRVNLQGETIGAALTMRETLNDALAFIRSRNRLDWRFAVYFRRQKVWPKDA